MSTGGAWSRRWTSGLGLLLVGALGACSGDSTGPEPGSGIRLNVFAHLGALSAAAAPALAAEAGSVGPVESIEVDDVWIVLGGSKLEAAGVDETEDVTFEESRVVALDLTGEPVLAATYTPVPPGTYKEFEIWVDKLETGNPAEESLISEFPELRDASVLARGRVIRPDGSSDAFDFATDADEDLELLISPFLTIEAPEDGSDASFSVALVIDVGSWFVDDLGGWLDPTDEADRSPIESKIGDSFDVFADLDEDGIADG